MLQLEFSYICRPVNLKNVISLIRVFDMIYGFHIQTVPHFIRGLFNDVVSNSGYITSNDYVV
jgi:hypothetical protein